jgi:hypothetical protein
MLMFAAMTLMFPAFAHAANDYRFDRDDYGSRIQGTTGDVDVWWCEATWKVYRDRAAPEATSKMASLSAARNDFEAVQVVVRPKKELKQLTAVMSNLVGPGKAMIPAKNVQVLQVYYHNVTVPTDRTSKGGFWPDALPQLKKPLDLEAEKNQPLWILVHVPGNAKPGVYEGALKLKAEGWTANVPIQLCVWDFALPETNHIDTAFGVSLGSISQFHNLKTDADKRKVWDMYMQSMADHRISPYDPAPMDPIQMKFVLDAKPPRAEFDFTVFDKAMTRAINKYHFTTYRLQRIDGLRADKVSKKPSIGPYEEGTPEYEAAFSSQISQLEKHFKEKGWAKMPYAYWTDEPKPENYEFVQLGMERIKKFAPGIQTMITTHMKDDTLKGPIDIWCPNSPNYNPETAKERQAAGSRYWWYLCTGPKAPFCTLFIDHPASEIRLWAWQSWQRDIVGLLIWETTYWQTGDEPQNPYEDPMSYEHHKKNENKYYGNGDGRLFYPPLSAFKQSDVSEKRPVIEPPVSCIRLELLREGIEDYEFLWLLRSQIAKKRSSLTAEQLKKYEALLEVPEEITGKMTQFTTDAKPIYERRAAIAEAIEQLGK